MDDAISVNLYSTVDRDELSLFPKRKKIAKLKDIVIQSGEGNGDSYLFIIMSG